MKKHPTNPYIQPSEIRSYANEEQEQDCPPDAPVNFLGDAATELGIQKPKEESQQQQKPPEEEDEEEKKRKEEEEKKNKDPNSPSFKRTQEKPAEKPPEKTQTKAGKDESIEIVRAQRDEARQKLEDQTKFQDELKTKLGVQDLVLLAPLTAYLSENLEGVVTKEKVEALLNDIKGSGQKIQEYEGKLKDTTSKLREVNIQFDPEFQRDHVQPWQEAQNALFLEFANVVTKGEGQPTEVIAPKAARKFYDALTADITKMDATQVKALLGQYVKEYEAETGGETIAVPSVTNIMSALRGLATKTADMHKAHTNWETEKANSKKKSALEEENATRALSDKQQRERGRLSQKAFNDFDFKSIEGVIDESEVEAFFDEEYKLGEKIFNPKTKDDVPSWDALLTRGVQAKMYPILLDKLKQVMADLAIANKKLDNGELRGNGGDGKPFKRNTGEKTNFLGEAATVLEQTR